MGPDATQFSESRAVRLRDGRRLGYAEYGDPGGSPVFAFHGVPGSRLMLRVSHEAARRHGIRLIAPDRPGFGLSNLRPGRGIADWPDDLLELADQLRIARFGVVGFSGGAPYAAACAWKIPDRLRQVALVSGLGPVAGAEATPNLPWRKRVLLQLGDRAPGLTRGVVGLGELLWTRAPGLALGIARAFAAPPDRPIVRRPEVRSAIVDSIREGVREGSGGIVEELSLFGRPWGFSLRDISLPVRLWHGEADRLVPVAMGRHLAALLPTCRAEFIPGAGHAWFFAHTEELCRALDSPDRT